MRAQPPMIVTNGVEFTPNIGGGCDASRGAARRRNKPLKIVIRYSITRLGRVQPRDSLPTQSSENIFTKNRAEGDARGFRQDLRGSIDCRSDAVFDRCYRWPYRTMTRARNSGARVDLAGENPLRARLRALF